MGGIKEDNIIYIYLDWNQSDYSNIPKEDVHQTDHAPCLLARLFLIGCDWTKGHHYFPV